MAVVFTNLSWWLWRGKEHDPNTVPSATLNSSMDLNLGMREFASVNGAKMRAESRRVKRKWHSREERKIDREYDLVLVPSDGGGWASGSESDDSDWSIGWMEPHAPDFQTDDDETEDSFAVLVPCYAQDHDHKERLPTPNNNQHLGAIVDLTNAESKEYLQQWLSSLQSG